MRAPQTAMEQRHEFFVVYAVVGEDERLECCVTVLPRVRASAEQRMSLSTMRTSQVPLPNGKTVPLSQIASVGYGQEYPIVWRRDRLPTVTVQADVVPGTQQVAVLQPERVLHIASRMSGRNVESVKVVLLRFYFGTIEHREAERREQIFYLRLNLRDGMQAAGTNAGGRRGEIDPLRFEPSVLSNGR